jgi:hypothetical protein
VKEEENLGNQPAVSEYAALAAVKFTESGVAMARQHQHQQW